MYGYAGVYRRKFQTHFSYSIYIYISVQFMFYSIKEACEIIIPNFNCNYICTWLNEQVKRLSATEEHRACVGPNYPMFPFVSWKSFVWECTVFVLEQNKGSMYGKPRIAHILSCMYPTTVCILKFITLKPDSLELIHASVRWHGHLTVNTSYYHIVQVTHWCMSLSHQSDIQTTAVKQ